MNVEIVDKSAELGCPTSRFLNKEEMQKIDADFLQARKSYIFKCKIPLSVDSDEAKALTDKYDGEVIYCDKRKDDLSEVKYHDLKKVALSEGYKWEETFVSKNELIEMIKEKRSA